MYNQNDLFGDIQGAQRSTVGGTKPNTPAPSPLFPTNSGIVPPGPKQHNLDDPGGGGGPMGFPPGNTSGHGPGGGVGNPLGYNFEVYTPPAPSPVPNPWGQGNDPFNVNGPGGPHSYGNPEGPDGRGFGGGGPMGFPGHDDRGPGGGPMPFPPSGLMGNAPGGPWGGNPNSYGPAEQNGGKGWQIPFDTRKLPQENPISSMTGPNGPDMRGNRWNFGDTAREGGPQGMRDRQGPWSRRLGQAPQGPGLFNPQPQEQQQMNPWLRNYLIQRRGL